MDRVVHHQKTPAEILSNGVWLDRLQPGGRIDPDRRVLDDIPGGRVWNDFFLLGSADQPFQMLVPDIRMPPNQYWPLHWHDCWIAVVILDGSCVVGDWWMQPGDVFISAPGIEYGPLLVGPGGCQLFEIFARQHLAAGGYAPEYRDHPTLQGTQSLFKERLPVNRRNEGRQVLPSDGIEGLSKHRLTPGQYWPLGDADDPERGLFGLTALAPGERIAPHSHDDWHALFVTRGTMRIGDRTVGVDDVIITEPGGDVQAIEAGPDGVAFMEMARTAGGMARL
jgi:quercetin dioxygenase-like cupin family protein